MDSFIYKSTEKVFSRLTCQRSSCFLALDGFLVLVFVLLVTRSDIQSSQTNKNNSNDNNNMINRLPWQAQSSTTIAQLSRRFNKAVATIVKANGLPLPGHPRRVHVLSSFGLGNVNGITARPMLKFPDLVCSVFVAWSGKDTVDWKSHRKPLTDLTFPFHLPRIGDTCRSIPPRITTLITDCTD